MHVKNFNVRLSEVYMHADEHEINNFLNTVIVKKTAAQLVQGETNYWSVLVFFENEQSLTKKSSAENKSDAKISFTKETTFSPEELTILDTLKQWRNDQALKYGIPGYMICSNAALMAISKVKPKSLTDLIKIKGFGEQKVAKFGNDILLLLNSF